MKAPEPKVTTNLDLDRLRAIAAIAKEILEWSAEHGHPESYAEVADQTLVRDFMHTLDLLETVVTRFGICSQLTTVALAEMDHLMEEGSLFWEFWQIDVEEFFSANLLELCYQLSIAWERLENFGKQAAGFRVLKGNYQKPSKVLIARHKFTHFQPMQFEDHELAQKYSILRRPYSLRDGRLEKELAKETMPRVSALIKASVNEGFSYVTAFRNATAGGKGSAGQETA